MTCGNNIQGYDGVVLIGLDWDDECLFRVEVCVVHALFVYVIICDWGDVGLDDELWLCGDVSLGDGLWLWRDVLV
jgi:hypothetical protein